MIEWDLRRLRLLHEVQERGTLGAVAHALAYSPSAVSQQLAVLEKEVGVPLLVRAGRGVRLTEAGALLAEHARDLLSRAEAAAADLAALSEEVRGTVRVGGLQSAARRLLIPAVAQLQAEHPQLRLELTEVELEQALPELRLGTMDLVVIDEYSGHPRPRPEGIRFTLLVDEPLLVVLPSGHERAAGRGAVRLGDLADEVWTASDRGTGHHAAVLGTCRGLGGFEPDVRHRSSDADVQLELVRAAGAVALLPSITIPLDDPAISAREVSEGVVSRRLFALTRDTTSSPGLRAFERALSDQAAHLVGPVG